MKLIEMSQKYGIQCDNPNCNYKEENDKNDIVPSHKHPIQHHVNRPCPKCGENLLTQKDHDDYIKLLKVVAWINKWFGWLGTFKWLQKKTEHDLHVHDGIHLTKRK